MIVLGTGPPARQRQLQTGHDRVVAEDIGARFKVAGDRILTARREVLGARCSASDGRDWRVWRTGRFPATTCRERHEYAAEKPQDPSMHRIPLPNPSYRHRDRGIGMFTSTRSRFLQTCR